jgi:ERCC4-type nuclease
LGYIIADEREPQKWRLLADQVEDILVDFIIVGEERSYVIERKTISDFWKSLMSGRLWSQLDRVVKVARQIDGYPTLLIVGDPGGFARKVKKFNIRIYYGTIASIMERGIVVFQVRNLDQAQLLFYVLKKRSGKTPQSPRLPGKYRKSLLSEEEMARAMLEGVRGIGEQKAKRLLEKYDSVKEIVNLPVEELIRALGKETGERFYRVVNGEYGD